MKGVILAAGYGSRFLPASKTIPKEMFPLVDTPAIDLIVQEFVAAGIREVLVVSSRRKKALEDYFDREVELEAGFSSPKHEAKRRLIAPPGLDVFFVRQKRMGGTGDALLLLEPFMGDSPFVVAYPDDILLHGPPLAGQLVATYEKTHKIVLAAQELAEGDISRYGVIDSTPGEGEETVRGMVEKPAPGTEPSRLVGYGRYLYTPEIFAALRETREETAPGEEFTQTAAINRLASQGRVVVTRFQGKILDVGTPQGYLESIVEYGLTRQEFRKPLLKFLRGVTKREEGR